MPTIAQKCHKPARVRTSICSYDPDRFLAYSRARAELLQRAREGDRLVVGLVTLVCEAKAVLVLVLASWVCARQQPRHSLFPTRHLHGF